MMDSTLELEEMKTEEPVDWLLSLSEFLEYNSLKLSGAEPLLLVKMLAFSCRSLIKSSLGVLESALMLSLSSIERSTGASAFLLPPKSRVAAPGVPAYHFPGR